MLDLSENALKNWLTALPQDVRAVVGAGEPSRLDLGLLKKLAGLTGSELVALLASDVSAAKSLGRIGRMRFLAWLLGKAVPREEWRGVINLLTGEGDEGEGGAQEARPSEATLLFLADMRAFNDHVVAPRLAAHLVAADILALAADASVVHEAEVQLTRGSSA